MYTEEELAQLTPEERAAVESEEGGDASLSLDELPDDDSPETDDERAAREAQEAADAAAQAAAKAPKDDDLRIPLLDDTPPEDAAIKLEQIATDKEALVQKFEDGEVNAKDYQRQLDELNKSEREIEQAQFKADIAREMRENEATEKWKRAVNSFMAEHPEYVAPTGDAANTPEGRAALLRNKTMDQTVRRLGNENPDLDGAEILRLAHEEISSAFGVVKAKTKETARERATREAVPTLANVPAAEGSGTDSRFAQLDRLRDNDPRGFEAALAKLSEADQNAYLSA